MKTYIHIKTDTRMSIAALSVIPSKWKSATHPLTGMIMQVVLNPHNRIVFSNEKKWTVDLGNNLDGSQGYYAEWKKANHKSYVCLPYSTLSCCSFAIDSFVALLSSFIWQNFSDGCQGLGMVQGVTMKGEHQGVSLWGQNSSESWLWVWLHKPIRVIKWHKSVCQKKKCM